jgi:hypothetical protein
MVMFLVASALAATWMITVANIPRDLVAMFSQFLDNPMMLAGVKRNDSFGHARKSLVVESARAVWRGPWPSARLPACFGSRLCENGAKSFRLASRPSKSGHTR